MCSHGGRARRPPQLARFAAPHTATGTGDRHSGDGSTLSHRGSCHSHAVRHRPAQVVVARTRCVHRVCADDGQRCFGRPAPARAVPHMVRPTSGDRCGSVSRRGDAPSGRRAPPRRTQSPRRAAARRLGFGVQHQRRLRRTLDRSGGTRASRSSCFERFDGTGAGGRNHFDCSDQEIIGESVVFIVVFDLFWLFIN